MAFMWVNIPVPWMRHGMAKVVTNNNSSNCFSSSFLRENRKSAVTQISTKQKTHTSWMSSCVGTFLCFSFLVFLLSFPRFCCCSCFCFVVAWLCWISWYLATSTSEMLTQHQHTNNNKHQSCSLNTNQPTNQPTNQENVINQPTNQPTNQPRKRHQTTSTHPPLNSAVWWRTSLIPISNVVRVCH